MRVLLSLLLVQQLFTLDLKEALRKNLPSQSLAYNKVIFLWLKPQGLDVIRITPHSDSNRIS